MKIQLPTFTGSFIKSPEMTNKAPALSELERHMIGAVMVETDASAKDYAVSIANHKRLPHVQAVQRDIARHAIKDTPGSTNPIVSEISKSQMMVDRAMDYLFHTTENSAGVPPKTGNVVSLNAARAQVAAQYGSIPGETGDVTQAA